MKAAIILSFLLISIACAVNPAESQKIAENPPAIPTAPPKQPVLVELYTSEG